MFEIRERDGLARICRFETAHGLVETPTLLPVVNPNIQLFSGEDLRERFGVQMLITNSYIIDRTEELRQRALENGVHALVGFQGPIMTDSGTFQSHVYGDVEVKPLEIVRFQRDIGVDVGTLLDVFTEPDVDEGTAGAHVRETIERARESMLERGEMTLALPVQGSVFPRVREQCARELGELDSGFYPIGGVVPLMESYRYRELVDVIVASKKGLPPGSPVHLFGAGHPMLFSLAVLLGCDLFDSSSYVKFAREGRMMFADGTRHLAEMEYLPCSCPVCRGQTPEGLRSMQDEERTRALASHNLHVCFDELRAIKQAISEGRLWELVERRCRCHPNLLDGLRALARHGEYLERFEPLSRPAALFYTGPETVHRPAVARYERHLLAGYSGEGANVLVELRDTPHKPYSEHYRKELDALAGYRCHVIVSSLFGAVPPELDQIYPIAQSIVPEELDMESRNMRDFHVERFMNRKGYGKHLQWSEDAPQYLLAAEGERGDPDVRRVGMIADFQFGAGAASALLDGTVELVKSRRTKKIRNVLVDGEHVLSLRAEDGLYTLKLPGARRLHAAFGAPRMRVVVNSDSVEFNREGKNVFARFVVECDDEIRPMEECLVVDGSDALVAVGRALLNREEMLSFGSGVAVKVREGLPPDEK